MISPTPQATQIGWFDKLKNSLNLDALAQKLNLSQYRLLDIALFFGVGFLTGFLWKRYANYFMAAVIFATLLFIFNQLDLFSFNVNWTKLQECCGVQHPNPDADILVMLWQWTKMNVLIIASFVLGFCFGAKVS
jgi:hypothetical protein